MLHVFVGGDAVGVRRAAHAFLDEECDGAFERVTVESFLPGLLEELSESISLFEAPAPVLLDFLFELPEVREVASTLLPALKDSSRTFVLMDGKPLAALAKDLKKYAKSYEEVGDEEKIERFNTFLLTDALLKRDKKLLWILFQRALLSGVAAEEIAGVLLWQIKTARVAILSASLTDSGLKEFPYKKGRSAAKLYSVEELGKLSESLVRIYHDGHAGTDMELGLERLVLSL